MAYYYMMHFILATGLTMGIAGIVDQIRNAK